MTIEKLKLLRKELHKYPELSGQEVETSKRIKKFVEGYDNIKIIGNVGGDGLLVIYETSNKGSTIVIRCELDALPIEETNDFSHKSTTEGVSHKCGHDGHMVIVAGLVPWLVKQNFQSGKVILLFQPAEETGVGAFNVLNDPKFNKLNPDYIFALHNIPGQPLHSIISLNDNFSSTVQSVDIQLMGKETHSATPEQGINPSECIAELTQRFKRLNNNNPAREDFTLFVPIYFNMGKKSYGISAGFGEMHYTLRTRNIDSMEKLKYNVSDILLEVCQKHQLLHTSKWFDYFPTVVNDDSCNQIIAEAAKNNNLDVINKNTPFRFGEDFGWFSQKFKTAMFGIGAGVQCPGIHQDDYDFPEDLIESGMDMFKEIINLILKKR